MCGSRCYKSNTLVPVLLLMFISILVIFMASTTDHESSSLPEPTKAALETDIPVHTSGSETTNLFLVDFSLRVLLFMATLTSLVVTVTSKQTKLIFSPLLPIPLQFDAKFTYSSAIEYHVAAISVACVYSIVTVIPSFLSISKPNPPLKLLLLLSLTDTVMGGIVASATGAVASIAYIGLKGNSHVRWDKVCNMFDKFCWHIGSSVVISLIATIVLVLLSVISTFSLYRRCR